MQDISFRFRKMAIPLVSFLVLVYFGFHALNGNNGLKAHFQLKQDIQLLEQQYNAIHKQRERLEAHVRLLRPEHVDPDYLEELSRRYLGYSHTDEIIILENSSN
ncbi:FtsB family cell division protein [Luteithermobacter gelatinilyticus]|uniref:FtsB family cell division protein n=1 Tax=Luteithermobacter gelatinilyticus TaxID=2582913 RepID=UPI00143CEAE0|nr:septum formation initiator family protein [Luteithermobacter gelatinilyticus]